MRWDAYEADRRSVIFGGLELILGMQPPELLVDSIWALASPEVFAKLTKIGAGRWTGTSSGWSKRPPPFSGALKIDGASTRSSRTSP